MSAIVRDRVDHPRQGSSCLIIVSCDYEVPPLQKATARKINMTSTRLQGQTYLAAIASGARQVRFSFLRYSRGCASSSTHSTPRARFEYVEPYLVKRTEIGLRDAHREYFFKEYWMERIIGNSPRTLKLGEIIVLVTTNWDNFCSGKKK